MVSTKTLYRSGSILKMTLTMILIQTIAVVKQIRTIPMLTRNFQYAMERWNLSSVLKNPQVKNRQSVKCRIIFSIKLFQFFLIGLNTLVAVKPVAKEKNQELVSVQAVFAHLLVRMI